MLKRKERGMPRKFASRFIVAIVILDVAILSFIAILAALYALPREYKTFISSQFIVIIPAATSMILAVIAIYFSRISFREV